MFSLRARVVLPVDRPPLDGGTVTVADGRIVSVGQQAAEGPVHDLGDVALLPGLVNPHVHLEYSLLDRPLGQPGMPFPAWIREVVAYKRQQQGPTSAAIAAGLRESLRHGVTWLGEIASPGWPAGPFADYPGQATVFLELLGLKGDQAQEGLDYARSRLGAADGTWATAGNSSSRLHPGLSPHAPYSVHPDLLAGAVKLAHNSQAPLAMHLAESPEEIELLRSGDGPFVDLLRELGAWNADVFLQPRRPLDYLRALAAAPRSLAIHGNYLDDAEIGFLGQNADRMAIVYCPRTHARFGHEPYPLARLLAAGATVAVGTDGRGSNPDLNPLAEMRHVFQHFPDVAPDAILRMGTLDAARALGISHAVGSLTPGKRANLTAVPLPPGAAAADAIQEILADTSTVSWVMCGGESQSVG
ncbi:MAG: amidohydrolase family protein [Pirellulales bacterium]